MPHRIQEDWYKYRQIIGGKIREELQKRIKSGGITRLRPDGGKVFIPIPRIENPEIVFGKSKQGIGRGDGKKGDVIEKGKKKGKGNNPGDQAGEGMEVGVDIDYILKLLKEELQLPDMKEKPNQTYEEIRVVYNGISKVGPQSLLHKKRTMKECMKRLAATGKLKEKIFLPGMSQPVSILQVINEDKRFREYNEIKIPSSNAVLFFMRDGSGSMDNEKCDIVSDISWWLNAYISKYYNKTERVFIWHDFEAREVSENNFYNLRYGGGTYCTSALKLMDKIIKNRFSPTKWNIYGFYFGDGECFGTDSNEFLKMLKGDLNENIVNLLGQIEVLHYEGMGEGLKSFLDKKQKEVPHLKNTEIKRPNDNPWGQLSSDDRDREIMRVLKELLGSKEKKHFAGDSVEIKEIA